MLDAMVTTRVVAIALVMLPVACGGDQANVRHAPQGAAGSDGATAGGAGGAGGNGVDAGDGSGGFGAIGGGGNDAGAGVTCSDPPSTADADAGGPLPVPAGAVADFAAAGWYPRLAVARDGSAIVAWQDGLDLVARSYASGSWEKAVTLAAVAGGPAVAVAPGGAAVTLYYESHGSKAAICSRERTAAGTWSAPTLLDVVSEGWWQDPTAPALRVAFDANGDAIAAFVGSQGSMVVRRFSASAGWGTPVPIGAADLGRAAVLATHPGGTTVVAWRFGTADQGVRLSGYTPGSGWEAPLELTGDDADPDLGVDPAGATLLLRGTWNGTDTDVQVASRSAAGSLGPAVVLGSADGISSLHLASDGAGLAVAAWTARTACAASNSVSVRAADGSWPAAVAIPGADGTQGAITDLATLAGRAALVWQKVTSLGAGSCGSQGVNVDLYDATSGWRSPLVLDASAETSEPRVAFASDGRALVVWSRVPGSTVLARWLPPP